MKVARGGKPSLLAREERLADIIQVSRQTDLTNQQRYLSKGTEYDKMSKITDI